MERIVVSQDEIAQTTRLSDEPRGLAAKLPAPIPFWARLSLSPLVLVLPVLCLVTILMRVATRGLPPRSRFAWVAYLSTLLIISGILTSIGAVVAFTFAPPTASVASDGLSELDSRTQFPTLPSPSELNAESVSAQLKPLVTVITPVQKSRFSRFEGPSDMLGAGILLQANNDGYLIATARHVVDGEPPTAKNQRVLVASTTGTWAGADVVARHDTLDLALLWLKRRQGKASFTLPVARVSQLKGGESIFVIGHPQGLRFTLSTGIISRLDQDTIQVSAPISPGNSGGPLFDANGKLIGIVIAMVDKNNSPNAENLNFAVRADALLDLSGWSFQGNGRQRLVSFQKSQPADKH